MAALLLVVFLGEVQTEDLYDHEDDGAPSHVEDDQVDVLRGGVSEHPLVELRDEDDLEHDSHDLGAEPDVENGVGDDAAAPLAVDEPPQERGHGGEDYLEKKEKKKILIVKSFSYQVQKHMVDGCKLYIGPTTKDDVLKEVNLPR